MSKRTFATLSAVSLLVGTFLSPVIGAQEHACCKDQLDRSSCPGVCPPGFHPATPPLNPALGCLPDSFYLDTGPNGTLDIPPGRCPEGWEPVTPPRNPMLICKPKNRAAEGRPQLGRLDPGCPEGWLAVTPPLNTALICLPNRIVATLPGPTGPGLPPGVCPEGWWQATPPLNPVLGCLPGTIVSP